MEEFHRMPCRTEPGRGSIKTGGTGLKNRAAYFGVFTALALIFSYVESLIPIHFGVPGIKLGLANLLIVIFLYKRNAKEALLLSIVRIVLAGFMFANLFSILYSLAGGILSLAVMAFLKKRGTFSVIGVSIAGGVCHNLGQLLVAMLAVETYQVGYYLPVLLIAGIVTGMLIGIVAAEVLKRLKEENTNTALDTTGYAEWEVLSRTMPYVDLYLYDLKHMDSKKHEEVVKVPNEKILANAKKLAENGKKLQIRIPVIPLFNHDEENIRKTAEFCKELGDAVTMIQLLPYHNLGVMKYLRISDKPVAEATPPSEEYMQKLKGIMEEYGLNVSIH